MALESLDHVMGPIAQALTEGAAREPRRQTQRRTWKDYAEVPKPPPQQSSY